MVLHASPPAPPSSHFEDLRTSANGPWLSNGAQEAENNVLEESVKAGVYLLKPDSIYIAIAAGRDGW